MRVRTRDDAFLSNMETVAQMLADDVPFEHIEARIEECRALDDEARAVLWLYGWCRGDVQTMTLDLGRSTPS